MKRTLLCAAFFGLASVAQAADLAPAYKSAPATALPYNWSGFYLGGNIGYGWANQSSSILFGATPLNNSVNPRGVIGGAQAGYNWQTGNVVLGLETDFQESGITGIMA